MRMHGGNVRMPDVGFVSAEQYRQWRRRRPRHRRLLAPALAVEVLSKSNTRAEMAQQRRAEYFASGSRLVWEIDLCKTVAVYTSPTKRTVLTEGDALDGGDVVPGFTLSLAELFDSMDDERFRGSVADRRLTPSTRVPRACCRAVGAVQ